MAERRPLRVLGHFHAYPPRHNAGAEWMAHSMLTHLAEHYGCDVRVVIGRMPRRKDRFDGIPVEAIRGQQRLHAYYAWADIALTHLDETRKAMYQAKVNHVPLVHLIHNDRQLTFHRVDPAGCQLAVANSEWIRAATAASSPGVPTCVVYPPVWVDRYRLGAIEPPAAPVVAMLNMSEAKGAATFYRMAKAMPDVRFVAVRGAYGTQVLPPAGDLPNVEVWRNQYDVRKVYRAASLVVMPSHYESWGRVAVEAAAAGRPCIAAPTLGLVETGVPARFAEPEDVDRWVAHARELLSPGVWRTAAYTAHERAVELEHASVRQLGELHTRLEQTAGRA